MRILAFLAAAILLAGCFGGDDEPEPSSTSSTPSTTSSSTSTTPVPLPNRPPTANVTADADNGTVPFTVNFTLSASDADGDNLTWSFDADGDGVAEANGTQADLPRTFPFNYTAAGDYRAALNVSDGLASVETVRLILAIDAAAPAQEFEDRGEYLFEFATGLCHAKEYTEEAPGIYTSAFGGGTWVFVETNDVAGLQYENNHPLAGTPAGFDLAVGEDCVDGDQTLV